MVRGLIPVILCGGAGERLSPHSTADHPKQFLPLDSTLSLFQITLQRVARICPDITPRIVTTAALEPLARSQLTASADLIIEPLRRNTAAAIALAAQSADPGDTLWIMPCDHLIENENALSAALTHTLPLAASDYLVLLGVPSSSPHTGYGYIQSDGFAVSAFHEKPDMVSARRYLDLGYAWNSGMIVARAENIIHAFSQHAPAYLSPSSYPTLPPLSFDKAVLEHMRDLVMVKADMGWRDVGQPEDRALFKKTQRTN